MPHVRANGVNLHYQQAGAGPDVVLLHAVTANMAVWLVFNLVDTLARDHRVTAYDLRGHGLSEATPTGYTSEEMAEDFRELHDALGLGPAYLVGHSFGAVVAMHVAATYPDLVSGVILSDPYFPGLARLEPNLGSANVWMDLREMFRHAGLDLSDTIDFTTLFRVVAGLSPAQLGAIRERMGPASTRWLSQLPRLADTTCGRDVFAVAGLTEERICSVHQPVVALYDEHSPFLATSRFLEENLPNCTVEIVPGAKHMAPVQNGPVFVELVRKHLVALGRDFERGVLMYFATFLLKNLVRRKARSLLTILGVAVAIGTVVTLRGVSYGFERSFRANFERRGIDLVVVSAGIPDQLRSDLDEKIGPRIEQVAGVRRVSAGLLELVDVEGDRSVISVLVNGWRPGGAQLDELQIVSGRSIRPEDSRAIMLGATLAKNLKKGVGDAVTVQRESFQVVGVYRSFDIFENGGAVVPLATLQDLMARPGSVTGFTVELKPSEDKDALADAVRKRIDALADDKGKPYGIAAQPTRDYVSGTIYIRMANGMAWITSAIALIIGSISILNTMIMAVMERTREIGILRAVGWLRVRVLGMVLGEALMLSLTGAAAGLGTAMLVVGWLAGVPQTSGFVSGGLSPVVVAEGLGLTLLMTLIGGVGPAYWAAGLQPMEALRHE